MTYVITEDPVMNLSGNSRLDARVEIFAFEGGSGGGIFVPQTTAAAVTTLISPVISADGELQLLIPYNSTKLEISIEPIGAGDGAESAEAVRMRMIADEDYVILTPQDALVTIADRDVVAGVSVETSAGLPSTEGAFRFTLSKPYSRSVKVPFLLTGLAGGVLVGEGTAFETLQREVTFVAGQTTLLLPVRPISTGSPTSMVLSLLGTEDYKLGGSTSSSLNPSATMHINDVIGTVTITAPISAATESNVTPVNGMFTVSVARNAGQVGVVALRLSVSGTAVNGSRYEFFNTTTPTQTYTVTSNELTQVQILAGANSVNIGVRPLDNQVAEGSESVQLAINNQGTDYSIGAPNSATVTIQDNEPTISVALVSNARRPSTPGVFRFSYPGVPSGQAVSQSVLVKYTFTGATVGVDFQSTSTVTIQPNTLSTDLTINPIVTGTATSLTVTVTPDTAYHVSTISPAATMSFSAADPETSVSDNKVTPGSVSSGSGGGGCGLGSGVATFVLLGLFGLFVGLRRRQE